MFTVSMPSDDTVANLKEKIMLKKPSIQHVDPDRLVVWKCPGLKFRGDHEEKEEFVARIHRFKFSEETQRLPGPRRVSSLSMPPDEMLLVQMPGMYSRSILLYSNYLPQP